MIFYALIVLIVIALNEILKRTGILHAKIIPFSNIVLSICFFLAYTGFDIPGSVLTGSLLGILATGIYSTVKNILQRFKT